MARFWESFSFRNWGKAASEGARALRSASFIFVKVRFTSTTGPFGSLLVRITEPPRRSMATTLASLIGSIFGGLTLPSPGLMLPSNGGGGGLKTTGGGFGGLTTIGGPPIRPHGQQQAVNPAIIAKDASTVATRLINVSALR